MCAHHSTSEVDDLRDYDVTCTCTCMPLCKDMIWSVTTVRERRYVWVRDDSQPGNYDCELRLLCMGKWRSEMCADRNHSIVLLISSISSKLKVEKSFVLLCCLFSSKNQNDTC